MGENSNAGKDPKRTGPADLPLLSIIRSLTTSQFYGLILALAGIFGAGYAIGQWASSTGHQRELASQEDIHRGAITAKDATIADRDETISGLVSDLETAKGHGEDALQVAAAADRSARAFRAKAEFCTVTCLTWKILIPPARCGSFSLITYACFGEKRRETFLLSKAIRSAYNRFPEVTI